MADPSPGPPRLAKAPDAATLSREGRGLDKGILIPLIEPKPSPLALDVSHIFCWTPGCWCLPEGQHRE
jgi:hypothetical protein